MQGVSPGQAARSRSFAARGRFVRTAWLGVTVALGVLGGSVAGATSVRLQATVASPGAPAPSVPAPAAAPDLRQGRLLLQTRRFGEAQSFFRGVLRAHPAEVQAELGLGDAQLGLHEFEAAEASYRAVTRQQPELWQAHRNLVVVEAALRRWEDFEGERRILRLARERGAPGISARESDVIDSFDVNGQHWVVRAYFEPMGRSQAIYNFERFSPAGHVEAYVSLEDAAAAQAALHPHDERVGTAVSTESTKSRALALNWYTGSAHGTIRRYPEGDPGYPRLRAAMLRWLETAPAR